MIRIVALLTVLLIACDPFPRDNPFDPGSPLFDAGRTDGARADQQTPTGPAAIVLESVRVTDSMSDSPRNNANGRAEPGEVLRLDLTLRNAGGSDASGVRVSLAAPSGCATVRTTGAVDLEYGTISRGAQATNRASFGDYFTVELSLSQCVAGSTVVLTYRANDASDRSWSGSLPILIQ